MTPPRRSGPELLGGSSHQPSECLQLAPGVSVVTIVRNEEDILPRFLRSVDWADEIIVVDDFSDDRTVHIASQYTEKLFQRSLDNYGEQKNFGVERARHEWILALDADEIVTPQLRHEIQSSLCSEEYVAYQFPFKNLLFGRWIRHGGFYPFYRIRLFKKGKGRWIRGIHEYVDVVGPVGTMQHPLEHHTVRSLSAYIAKRKRFSDLHAEQLFDDGVRVTWWSTLYKPMRLFAGRLVLRAGFLDGMSGLVWHALSAIELFLTYAKIMEKQKALENRAGD